MGPEGARVCRTPAARPKLGPTPEAGVYTAARRIGPMGGWRVGPDVQQKGVRMIGVPRPRAAGDYTRTVIIAAEKLRGAADGRESTHR